MPMKGLPEGWIALGSGWTITPRLKPDLNWEKAIKCARGPYQRKIIRGDEALSGSTLEGRAAKFSAKYASSRSKLLTKLTEVGVKWSRQTLGSRIVLCIGELPSETPETPNIENDSPVTGLVVRSLDDLFK